MKKMALLSVLFICSSIYSAEKRPNNSLPKSLQDKKNSSSVGTPGRKIDSFDQLKREWEQKKMQQQDTQQNANVSEQK